MVIHDLRTFLETMPNPDNSKYSVDEELISCVSGGAALRAVNFIEPERKILRPFLSPPIFVPLEAPSIAAVVKEFTFSSLTDASKFIQTLEASGMSAAVRMQRNSIEFQTDVHEHRTEITSPTLSDEPSKRTSALIKMRCHFIPVHSFRIGKEHMRLSPEAKAALNLVTDSTTARVFMSDFGSHISDGTQHIGGFFIHQLCTKADEEISVDTLEGAARSEWNASRQLGYQTYRCHMQLSSRSESNRASDESECKQHLTITHSVQSIGPACKNLELFQTIFLYPQTSLLIDRGPTSSFAPVWEIIDQLYPYDSTMHEIAELLKQAWLTAVVDYALTDALLCEIDRVLLLPPSPIEYLQNSPVETTEVTSTECDLVDQLKEQLTEYINAVPINYDTITENDLLNKVSLPFVCVF